LDFREACNILLDEARNEFRAIGKHSAVSYILKRPTDKNESKTKNSDGDRAITPFEDYLQIKTKLERILHIGHPLLCQVLELWSSYSSTRAIDIPKIRSQKEAFRIFSFRSSIMVHAEKSRAKLWNDWFESILKACTDSFLKKRKKATQMILLKSLQTLIKLEIISITNGSLDDYFTLFSLNPMPYNSTIRDIPNHKKPPRFSISLNFDKKSEIIELDPPREEIEEAIIECGTLLVSTLSTIPNFERIIQKALESMPTVIAGYENEKKDYVPPGICL
jgi:dynein heavy chain